MKRPKTTLALFLIQLLFLCSFAQDDVMKKVSSLRPGVTSRSDVIRILGVGEVEDSSTWYYFPDKSVEVTFSNGRCTEGWLITKDRVAEIAVNFREHQSLLELKRNVNLEKLKYESAFDVVGERHYFDESRGVVYGVNISLNTWFNIRFVPGKIYRNKKCKES